MTIPSTSTWRRLIPSFQMVRLGILMAAIILGLLGMKLDNDRVIWAAIIIGGVGVVLRFLRPRIEKGA